MLTKLMIFEVYYLESHMVHNPWSFMRLKHQDSELQRHVQNCLVSAYVRGMAVSVLCVILFTFSTVWMPMDNFLKASNIALFRMDSPEKQISGLPSTYFYSDNIFMFQGLSPLRESWCLSVGTEDNSNYNSQGVVQQSWFKGTTEQSLHYS